MKTKTNTLAIVVGMSLLLGAAGLSACANKVETAVKPCPCAAGFVCCESGVCAQDQSGCGQATAALSASARGEWTGYIENFQSVSSDDSIAISISAADDGTLSGTVRIGQGPPPPPATDGTVPWPPTLHGDAPVPLYIPGFVYSVEDISWQARRLKFRIPKYQPWQPWCALQQSYEYTHCDDPPGCTTIVSDGFYCLPTGGAVPDEQGNCSTVASATTPARAVDCAMGALCDTVGGCNCQSGRLQLRRTGRV